MAESISEGTLSTFTKQVGDQVELDEEIASIETDKIDVQVNSPAAGKITKLLVSEGDTVTVGQDIAELEEGAGGDSGGEKEASAPAKAPASPEQPTEADKKQEPQQQEPKKEEPKEEKKEAAAPPPPPPKKEEKKPAPAPKPKEGKEEPPPKQAPFSRTENRVCLKGVQSTVS